MSIFLTENSTRHSILTKQKTFREPEKKSLQSNSKKLTGDTNETPIEVDDGPVIVREESEDSGPNLQDLPDVEELLAGDSDDSLFVSEEEEAPRRSKRPRASATNDAAPESSSGSEPLPKRRKEMEDVAVPEEQTDEKKKMAMNTHYDGFSIYGRVLCLIVKRKDKKGKAPAMTAGQAMMEDWITSTQMPAAEDDG